MNWLPQTIQNKLIKRADTSLYRSEIRNKKIVFTNGCFDLLHCGHIQYLEKARSLGDFLWIGLNSDESVRQLKGKTRPIITEMERAIMLSAFYFVDAITIFAEQTPIELIHELQPDIHVKGGDYIAENLPEYSIVVENGGEVKILPFLAGHSTSSIVEKIRND